jgi:hypothetical protein
MRTAFWSENLKERNYFEDLGIYGRIILKTAVNKEGVSM